jgi:PAS domain S-box-containing protein
VHQSEASQWGHDAAGVLQEQLRVSELLTGTGSWSWDLLAGQLVCSEGLLRLLGLSSESQFDSLTGAQRARLQRALSDCDPESSSQRLSLCRPGTDCMSLSLELRSEVLRDSEGKALKVVGGAREVTLEGGGEWSEALRWVADQDQRAFWIREATSLELVHASAGYEKLSGRKLGPLDPDSWFEAIHPEDRERVRAALAEHAREGSFHEEYRVIRPDGTTRLISDRQVPVQSRRGWILGIAQDVTEGKADATTLPIHAAVEALGEGVLICDAEARIQYANPAFEAASGYSLNELIGENPRIFSSGAHDSGFYEEMWAVLRSGKAWRGRMINKRKDGSRYIEESHIRPIRNQDEETTHYVAVKRDVTQQVDVEARLRESQQLEALGLLSGGVAHDFNNMLTVIMGHSEVALEILEEGSPARRALETILAAGQTSAGLTRQLLALSRRRTPERHVLDLREVVGRTERFLLRALEKDIQLEVRQPGIALSIRVGESQLESAILNLITNASHAISAGGTITVDSGRIEVGAGEQPGLKPGSYVVLSISDTGRGIAPDALVHIFEPFFTTKRVGQGTGLGLSSVQQFVEESEGVIEVESQEGQGSTFRLYFPEVSVSAEEPTPETKEASGGDHSETILVVEDEELVRDLIQLVLSSSGYAVLTAASGEEALETFRRRGGKVDLVLTDLGLPGISGADLVNRILAEAPRTKVVVLSGYASEACADLAARGGELTFLQKPILPRALLQHIREVLDAGVPA